MESNYGSDLHYNAKIMRYLSLNQYFQLQAVLECQLNVIERRRIWNLWSSLSIHHHQHLSTMRKKSKQSSSRAIAKVQEEKVSKVAGKIKWRISSWWRTGGGSMQTQNSISRSLFTSNDALELISWSEDCSTPVVCTNLLSFPFWSGPLHLIRFLFLFIVAGK